MAKMKPFRDVMADTVSEWIDTDVDGEYQYVDKIINDLWNEGYQITKHGLNKKGSNGSDSNSQSRG